MRKLFDWLFGKKQELKSVHIQFPIMIPVEYDNTPECKKMIKYGRYLVIRKDGKMHLETFNGTGWAYNNNAIVAYYEPKIA